MNNKISRLPEKIGHLKELRIIDCQNNMIDQLPHSLAELEKLQSLNLRFNKLKFLPDIFDGLPALIAYLKEQECTDITYEIGLAIG